MCAFNSVDKERFKMWCGYKLIDLPVTVLEWLSAVCRRKSEAFGADRKG